MTRSLALLTVCALAACLAGCVSEGPAPAPAAPLQPVKVSGVDPEEAARRELRLAQALVQLDQRVDRFVMLSSQPGEDARAERNLLGPALAAHVAQFQPELIELVGDASNPERRRIAAKSLAFSDDPAAVTGLVNCLAVKGDVRLLTNATYALGRIHSPSTPTAPLLALLRDPDADVRSNSLMALWHVFDAKHEIGASPLDPVAQRDAMTLLETALFDPADPLVRAHAAAAVGALGDPRGVDPLLNMLRDEHPLVRTQTAIALGKLGDEKAIPALVKVIDNTPAGTPRRAVLLALTALLEKKGITVPTTLGDESRAWERFVRESLGAPEK